MSDVRCLPPNRKIGLSMPNLNKGYKVIPGEILPASLSLSIWSEQSWLFQSTSLHAHVRYEALAGLGPTLGHPLGHGQQAAPTAGPDRSVRASRKRAHFIQIDSCQRRPLLCRISRENESTQQQVGSIAGRQSRGLNYRVHSASACSTITVSHGPRLNIAWNSMFSDLSSMTRLGL